VSGPAGVTFGDAAQVNTTATFPGEGTYLLQLSADDGELVASDALTVTVTPPNAAPQVEAGIDQSIELPLDTVNLAGTVTDDGLPASGTLTTQWSVVSGPAGVTFGDAAQVNTTATFPGEGTYLLQLLADDGALSASDTLTVTVIPANQPPQVEAGGDQSIELPLDTVNLAGTVTDDGLPASGTLTTQWSVLSGPGGVTFGDAAAVNTTVTFPAEGTYLLQLTADDGELNASDTLVVTVASPGNEPPQVDAGADQSIELPLDTVNLAGTVTDDGLPASGTLTTQWSVLSGPAGVTFGDAAQVNTTATFPEAGTYLLQLTADDGELVVSDTLTITVTPEPVNQAPQVEAGGDQSIELPLDTVNLAGTVTDDGLPASGTLTTLWSGPAGVTFGDAAQVNTTATFPGAGTYLLQLTADDGELVASDTLTVTVTPPNAAPQVEAGGDQSIELPLDTVNLAGTVTDDGLPASATLTTLWSGPAGVTFGDAAQVNTTATFPGVGTYLLQLLADDGALSASDTLTVIVTPANQAPQVEAGGDQTIRLPMDTVILDGTVTDDGLPSAALTTQWSVLSGPAAVTFGDATAVNTMALFSDAGIYELQLTGDDGELVASDALTVTVEAAPVLTQISVTPPSVTLTPGASQPFAATGEDQYGDPVEINVAWTATGGSIDAGGNYVAGAVDGSYTVTASDGPVSGQAMVNVESVVSAPTVAYLQFDGANDVVTVPDDRTLDITSAITVEAWIRPDSISNGRTQDRILYKGGNYDLSIATGRTGCAFGTTGDVKWRAKIGGSSQRICGGVLTPGVWHHVAGSYNGSQFVLYLDGAVVTSVPLSGAMKANNQALYLGNQSSGTRAFHGSLDEVRIWNRALSAAEIAANRNAELAGSETGLVAYYRFNEGTGQLLTDQTVSTNDGVLGSSLATENNDPQWGSQ
jgi:hypothetical protein